ncbi:MAG: DUF1611 domain-containing protein [Candidatus Sumerlaeaceae bacterium]|jgi:uncharacterized NAD-dependent epimerase/dehydratase family protein
MQPRRRIAILAEGAFSIFGAKTAVGVLRYSRHQVVAVIDSTKSGKVVEDILGFGGDIPIVESVEQALAFRPEVLLIGIAPTGGQLLPQFRHALLEAIRHGLDIWSGLHYFLSDDEELAAEAARCNVRLWDVRKPRRDLVVGSGKALTTKAYVVLTVGTDCNVGKMTAALELRNALAQRGVRAAFVATGQTGILIEGEGTPLDAVPGDFMSGEVEHLVLQKDAEGAEVILVEGQGSLLHPGFGPVTLALMLGAMPDDFILCSVPTRQTYRPNHVLPIPPLKEIIRLYEGVMGVAYKAPKVRGLALNTSELSDRDAFDIIERYTQEIGLPVCDPFRTGVHNLVDALLPYMESKRTRPVTDEHSNGEALK